MKEQKKKQNKKQNEDTVAEFIPHLDPQENNQWGGLPDVTNHKCSEYENTDQDKGIVFCGVCGNTLRELDDE